MLVSSILSALLPLAGTISAAALTPRALTAQQVVDNINKLTQLSQQLQPIVFAVQTGDNAVYKRQGNPFEAVIDGYQQITRTAEDDNSSMDGQAPFAANDAQKVCNAFSNFVVVHQELLRITIGKSAILEGIFQGPVAATLRGLESALDTFSFDVIDASPACETSATKKKEQLDKTLGQAICAYTPGGSLGVDLFC